jgi:DNA repair photolyase
MAGADDLASGPPGAVRHGRGATLSPDNRYGSTAREALDDGWGILDEAPEPLQTTLTVDASRSVISYNRSPDVGFDRSINPYRGCEHGCVYCFARPTHAYLDLSPGLDFESRLFYKPEAPALLRKELGARGYQPAPMAVGINTDAYQPVERRLGLTRRVLEVLLETRHPFTIVTKSALIERDLDLLSEAARHGLTAVWMSFSTLRRELARRLEPRAAAPQRRLETLRRLAAAGVPVGVLAAPVIPALTDDELDGLLAEAREAGARFAGYALLRLPLELKDMFHDWLARHEPLKAQRVINRIRDSRGGKDYDARFGERMTGTGEYAAMIAQRFRLSAKRLGYGEGPALDCSRFVRPDASAQISLF